MRMKFSAGIESPTTSPQQRARFHGEVSSLHHGRAVSQPNCGPLAPVKSMRNLLPYQERLTSSFCCRSVRFVRSPSVTTTPRGTLFVFTMARTSPRCGTHLYRFANQARSSSVSWLALHPVPVTPTVICSPRRHPLGRRTDTFHYVRQAPTSRNGTPCAPSKLRWRSFLHGKCPERVK